MAPVTTTLITDRRRELRVAPAASKWSAHAVLRPGVYVTLVNISNRGVLFESSAWLRPGARTELQLETQMAQVPGIRRRHAVRGHLDRCHVAALAPLCYRGAIVFDDQLEIDLQRSGSE